MGNPKGVKRDFDALEKRRRQAARCFERGLHPAEVARRLGVHRQSTTRWRFAWSKEGLQGLLKSGRAGRKPKLNARQRERVSQALLKGPQAHGYANELWTCPRVAEMIQRLTGVKYHPDHVWRLLKKLGFSCQRPVSRALERDEEAIATWRQQTWPALKKKPGGKAAR